MARNQKQKLKFAKKHHLHYSGDDALPIRLDIYATKSGKEPFSDWLDSLDLCVRGKIEARIDRLEQGNLGKAKALKGGRHESKKKD